MSGKIPALTGLSRRLARHWTVSGVLVLTAGCVHHDSRAPLTSQSFYGGAPPQSYAPVAGERKIIEDQSSELNRVQPTTGVQIPTRPAPTPARPVVPATQPGTSGASTTKPSARLASITPGPGQYQVLGTVVAVVNNTPIYAKDVLNPLNKIFSQRARELGMVEFRDFAQGKIRERLQELVDDEVLFAAAQRGLSDEDQKLADTVTLKWRLDQITQAGGSLQVARTRAAAEGDDFDELVHQQYRRNMIEVYRFKKISPRIQVTSDDLRRYYDKHKEDEFTAHASVRFRLLEVSVAKSGEKALDKITLKLQRARNGEDFKAMCAAENDDAVLASVSGDLGWKDKGSLPPALQKVEQAIWELKPGAFTDVIQAGNAYYLAQVVEVHPGRVRPFNEQPVGEKHSVQEEIENKLRNEQFRLISAEINDRLMKDAVWNTDESKLQLCLDMAMQRYADWRAGGQTTQAQ